MPIPDGQARRAWLDQTNEKINDSLSYYLGPAFAPMAGIFDAAAMVSPGEDFMDMHSFGTDLMQSKTGMGAAQNALGLGAAVLDNEAKGTERW